MRSKFHYAVNAKDFAIPEDLPAFTPTLEHIAYDLSGSDHFPRELYRLVQDAELMLMTHIVSWQRKGKVRNVERGKYLNTESIHGLPLTMLCASFLQVFCCS